MTVGEMASANPDWPASQVRTSLEYLAAKGNLMKTRAIFSGKLLVAYRLATESERDPTSSSFANSPALAMQLAIQSALCGQERLRLPIHWARGSQSAPFNL
ncbi:hypothetical protein BKK80_35105 (plasmid) [Cupriavidus malaysiensis]|uniref:Uncharacterized protein n=1 Tax=Cupriavidus malaysiensis TaxID=367825 RepID=A0ABN4TZR7_9BURK|nr:hypothetical protein BKK80_35105 [Cupriavidus malaysiensis]